jgi:hypothetical protein
VASQRPSMIASPPRWKSERNDMLYVSFHHLRSNWSR